MARKIVDPKQAPILWSTVKEAIDDINDNFEELYTVGPDGVNLSAVNQPVIPDVTETRDLGSVTKRWKDLYLSGSSIDLGGAVISRAENGSVVVPGINEQIYQPTSIRIDSDPAGGPYTDGVPVVIDHITFLIAYDPDYFVDRDYVPTVYSPVLDGQNYITDVTIVTPSPYKNGFETPGTYATINTDDMWALPPGTDINDWDALNLEITNWLEGSEPPYGPFQAGVESEPFTQPTENFIQGIQGIAGSQGTQGIQGIQGASGGGGGGSVSPEGNTIYVTKNGNDTTNAGTTPSAGYLTIKKALSVATAGQIINISAGVYEEIFPLIVPAGVTVKGAGLRATQVRPTLATNDLDCFLLNGQTTVEDLTVRNMFYNSANNTGYAFRFAPGCVIAERSPYVQRVTVLNFGSTTSPSDPYGFALGDAGRGALADGSAVSRNSIEAAMLFNESTFIVPNSRGLIMTNGARVEWLTCFVYFADLGIEGITGSTGRGGDGKTIITFTGLVGPGFEVGETVTVTSGDSTLINLLVDSVTNNGATIYVDGRIDTLEGVDTTPTEIIGSVSGTTATTIVRYDRSEFAAELRSISGANVYGNQGTKADGDDVRLHLMAHNFAYIGTGADLSNNLTSVVQENEVIEINGGRVYFNSIDQNGNYRVGDLFKVDFETGDVTFDAGDFNISNLTGINFTDGVNTTTVNPSGVTTGNIVLAGSTISTNTGDLTLDPGGAASVRFNGNAVISGDFFVGFTRVIDNTGTWTGNPAGLQGATGVQGAIGFQGAQGIPGEAANQGIQGIQGARGFQGFQGAQGTQGTDGLFAGQGIQGIQGIQGLQSPQGTQGAQGAQGIIGFQGIQGIQGRQGTQGSFGIQGSNGIQGIQGNQGTTGSTGNQGVQGSQGVQGTQGTQGISGQSFNQGIQGIQGTDGLFAGQGIQGVQGSQGAQGVQGITGSGTQGAQGTQGTTGDQGIQGTAGDQGIQGTDGSAVFQGIQGIQGVQGSLGLQGSTGENGIQGIQGITGDQGIQGTQGIQGVQGITVLYTRTSVNGTATSLASNGTANLDITGFKGYGLFKIQTSHAAWVRIYADAASRTADASRTQEQDPLPGAGVIAEVITAGAETVLITPSPFGFNNENPVTTNIPVAVTNLSGSTNSVTVTLTIVQIES